MASTTKPAKLPSPAEIGPAYTLEQKNKNVEVMKIGQWVIVAEKRPILNGKEIELVEKSLNLPLPEMTFGNNSLILTYTPEGTSASPSSLYSPAFSESLSIRFDTISALSLVATGEGWEDRVGGGVLVAMAESWTKRSQQTKLSSGFVSESSGSGNGSSGVEVVAKAVRPHDWTFSTTYKGDVVEPNSGENSNLNNLKNRLLSTSSSTSSHSTSISTSTSNTTSGSFPTCQLTPQVPQFTPSTTHSIPLSLLARQDPLLDRILFYSDVPLFNDELHDFGESILNVRIRIMPHSFFILSRLFVRVDSVLFRIFDVRVYHEFGSGEVIRESSGMEEDYEAVKRKLVRKDDLSPLTDPNWVYGIMIKMDEDRKKLGEGLSDTTKIREEKPTLHHRSSSSSRSKGKPWPGLGRQVEVLKLPGTESPPAALQGLSI